MKAWSLLFLILPIGVWSATTEFRVGYFYPASHLMRKVYKNGNVEFEVEETASLSKDTSLWFNFNFFERHGRSLGLHDCTSIQIYPLSAGLKYAFSLTGRWQLYLGVGASYSWVKIHDKSPFVQQHIRKNGWGVVGKSGFLYFFTHTLFFDFFADYYYTKISATHHHGLQSHALNVGGLRTGIGLGVSY